MDAKTLQELEDVQARAEEGSAGSKDLAVVVRALLEVAGHAPPKKKPARGK